MRVCVHICSCMGSSCLRVSGRALSEISVMPKATDDCICGVRSNGVRSWPLWASSVGDATTAG